MHLCLFEDAAVRHLFPLALTRAAGDLRLGMHTLIEMQQRAFAHEGLVIHTREAVAGVTAQEHPGALVNRLPEATRGVLFLNQRFVPEPGEILERLRAAAKPGEPALAFHEGDTIVALWHPNPPADFLATEFLGGWHVEGLPEERLEGARLIGRLWHLVEGVERQVAHDFFAMGRRGQDGASVHESVVIAGEDVYLAPGAEVRPGAILNAQDGPIYIDAGAVVEEGAVALGPLYLGPGGYLRPASRVRGSALGPVAKVGGEVHESVVHSYSSKSHDGYLGNSYLGRWCNLGADTNTSNLRNDYADVTLFDAVAQDFVPSGRRFLGLVMADHTKCSINSMFNTGTVVGVSCNLFGSGFPPRHVPSFSWGGAEGLVEYRLEKALRVAEAVMARRDVLLTEADRRMLAAVFEATASERG